MKITDKEKTYLKKKKAWEWKTTFSYKDVDGIQHEINNYGNASEILNSNLFLTVLGGFKVYVDYLKKQNKK